MKTVVYFIRPVGMNGPIKIGCSQNPLLRLRTFEAWCPFPLENVAQIEGNHNLERRFHAKFREQHSHCEWFHWSQELEDTISAINAGAFNCDTLPAPAIITRRVKARGQWTPEQRYQRSVWQRLQFLRRRGAEWARLYHDVWHPHENELGTLHEVVEAKLAAWQERFPRKSRRASA